MGWPSLALIGTKRIVWNRRFIAVSFLSALLLAVSLPSLHAWQLRRLAHQFLEQATACEQQGRWSDAQVALERVIALRPDSTSANARVRLARLLDRMTSTGHVGSVAQRTQVLRAYRRAAKFAAGDESTAAQQRIVELLIELRRFREAERELADQISRKPDDPRTRRFYAIALASLAREQDVVSSWSRPVVIGDELQRALDLNPNDLRLCCLMAQAYRDHLHWLSPRQRAETRTLEARVLKADEWMNKAVAANANDPAAWLARYDYRVSHRLEGADADLRKAVELGPRLLTVRLTAAAAARQQGDPSGRSEALAHYRYVLDHIDPRNESAWIGVGECLVEDKRLEEAIGWWTSGLERLGADNIALHDRLALASLRAGRNTQAEHHLREVLKTRPDLRAARLLLATLITRRGGSQEYAEADRLLEPLPGQSFDPIESRVRANLLAQRLNADGRQRARSILERLVQHAAGESTDRVLLARLCELAGDYPRAEYHYTELLRAQDPSPEARIAYGGFLARRQDWTSLLQLVQQLESSSPPRIEAVRLRVAWLQGVSRTSEVDTTLLDFFAHAAPLVDEPSRAVALQRDLGEIAASAGRLTAAEHWHRRAYLASPAAYAGLARTLADQDRVAESLELLRSVARTDLSSTPARLACEILARESATPADFALGEPLIEAARARFADEPAWVSAYAHLLHFQGKLDEARQLLERAVAVNPRNVVALNNLALVLAERPDQRSRGIAIIDQALDIAGDQPALLDTKAVILLRAGETQQAADLLANVLRSPSSNATHQFHLAVARRRLGQVAESQSLLANAQRSGLKTSCLLAADRRFLDEILCHDGRSTGQH